MNDIDALVQRLAAESPERLRQLANEVDSVIGNKPFVPNEGPQSAAYYSKADVLLYGGQAGGGKDLEINTLVPVPLSTDASGYKRHGDLMVGDKVFAPDGNAVSVTGIPLGVDERDAYEVEFDTGEIIIAGSEHLWQTWTYRERDRLLRSSDAWRENRKKRRASRAKENAKNYWLKDVLTKINQGRQHDIIQAAPGIRTTAQIKDTLLVRGARLNHSIDVIKPIHGEHQELPCDPYLFGLWLGDGFTNHSAIVMMESDWIEIIDILPTPSSIKIEKNKTKTEMGIRRFNELAFVRKIGAKHIPIEYLRASREQRLDLLRGMMDTDGTVDHRGHCELGFSNARLAHDACELVNSLGIKASINIRRYQKEEWRDHFRMKFISDDVVFRLPRKSNRQKPIARDTVRRRYIKDVRYIGKRQTSCIAVEGGLYCVGDTFIATHNSALGLGLAINEHERSIVVRKQFTDLQGLIDTAKKIVGSQEGFVGGNRPIYRMGGERVIHFEGYGDVEDIEGKQGTPHDLIFIDEAAQLPELAIRLLRGWNRTTKKGQRCRMILASNPPLNSTGDWMITYFGPWLDARHPNPAKPGELRWFISDEEGNDKEVSGPDDYIEINGKKYYPESRTFIPASVSDNPYLDQSYASTLNSLPEPFRSALRDGNFMAARADDEWQCIPTDWVRQAQKRWKENGRPIGIPMCAIAVDIAQGGADSTILAPRYDGWFDNLIKVAGSKTPDGPSVAGLVIQHRRDNAEVVLDYGGGYGGDAGTQLIQNGIKVIKHKGAESSAARTRDKALGFVNKRTEIYWRLREALDPSQDGGSPIMLPDDPELLADLTAPTYEVTSGGIKLEPKDKLKKRIGRSPDKGDAVAMCWAYGKKIENIKGGWEGYKSASKKPNVILGHQNKRRTAYKGRY